MKMVVMLAILTCGILSVAIADVPVGRVGGERVPSITVPVYHDTTGRNSLTSREEHFLSTVPTTGGLRDAVREMLLANVVHVPASSCGNYRAGDSAHYWSIYQAWTGKSKVRVPLIQGPRGECGPRGFEGPQGPQGPQGIPGQGTVINNYSFNTVPVMSYQIGGAQAPVIVSTQLGSVGLVPTSKINVSAYAAAPTSIDIDVSQQQQQQQDQSVAIDP